MFRIKLILIGVGGILAYFGFQEFQVSKNTGSEPVLVNLEELEKTKEIPDSGYLEIENAWEAINYMTYYYEYPEFAGTEEKPEYEVTHAYVPLISSNHPYSLALDDLEEKYPDGVEIPEEEFPVMQDFQILLKTNDYKTLGDIPEFWVFHEKLEGVVINKINSFESGEEDLIRQSFPNLDFNKILILEKDRKPSSSFKSFGMMGGGFALIIIGIGLLVVGFKKE